MRTMEREYQSGAEPARIERGAQIQIGDALALEQRANDLAAAERIEALEGRRMSRPDGARFGDARRGRSPHDDAGPWPAAGERGRRRRPDHERRHQEASRRIESICLRMKVGISMSGTSVTGAWRLG